MGDLQERPGQTLEGVIEGLPTIPEEHATRIRGKLVRIAPDGTETEIWRSATQAPFCLVVDPQGRATFGTGEPARIFRTESADEVALIASFPEEQVTGLLAAANGVVAATSNPAAVYRMEREPREAGVFVSRPFDAGTLTRWGAIRWRAEGVPGRAEFYTRTGNTAEPDATWSAWGPALTDPDASKVGNPDGRFVQWRARLAGGDLSGSRISVAAVSYAAMNRAPGIRAFTLDGPKPAIAGTANFRFAVADPDGDPLAVEVRYRKRGTDAWSVAGRVDSLDTTPGSADDEDSGWKSGKLAWDASAVPEGTYEIAAVASDRAANFAGEAKEKAADPPLIVTVDRTPPVLDVRRIEGGIIEARGVDALSPINRLEAMRDGRPVFQGRPVDGVSDSRDEVFRIEASDLGTGAEAIQMLRVLDDAGNVSEKPVPAP